MTKHHTPEEMRLCANFLDEMKVNHKVIKDALRISAAMLRDIADAKHEDHMDAERWRFFSIHDVSWDADENGVYLWVGHAKAIKGATLEDAIDAAISASKVKP